MTKSARKAAKAAARELNLATKKLTRAQNAIRRALRLGRASGWTPAQAVSAQGAAVDTKKAHDAALALRDALRVAARPPSAEAEKATP